MKKILLSLSLLFAAALAPAGAATKKKSLPPMKEFVGQLMSRMTLQEKTGQLNLMVAGDITTGGAMDTQVGGDIANGNMGGVFNIKGFDKIKALQEIAVKKSRLGIPLLVGMDVIHGYETIFPIPLALSCSWNLDAVEQSAAIAAKEASADGINWTYSPMVDVALDARWGRVSEGNGEDPYLSACMGAAMVRGYQGDYSSKDNIMACLKHYALYGAVESGLEYNTTDMSRLRMRNQYLLPYETAVKAGVGSVMSSFNLIDYVPATASRWLLNDVLRKEWKFDGFVVTHGTDTMEETSFFLSLTVPSGKPVVLTGAMLPSTAVSADGPRNIFNAVCTAKSPAAAPYGVLVAMNGELFTARGLYKSKTVALDTFTSRLGGAVGWTQNGEAHFSVPAAPEGSLPSFRESKLLRASALPRIAVLFTWAGADGTAASAYLDAGFQGLVTAGFGDGNIPKAMMPALEAAVRSGLPVVRSSRCAFGPVLEAGEVDDRKYGFVCGGALSAVQCRILLQLALFERPGATREDLQALFRRFAG